MSVSVEGAWASWAGAGLVASSAGAVVEGALAEGAIAVVPPDGAVVSLAVEAAGS
ncbi:hypothetical protein AB4144_61900 [Rhizobiaceae sp. 2RAB30]